MGKKYSHLLPHTYAKTNLGWIKDQKAKTETINLSEKNKKPHS